jgi:hypothetical protein
MSCEKYRPKGSPICTFLPKLMHILNRGKIAKNVTSAIFEKVPKVNNLNTDQHQSGRSA